MFSLTSRALLEGTACVTHGDHFLLVVLQTFQSQSFLDIIEIMYTMYFCMQFLSATLKTSNQWLVTPIQSLVQIRGNDHVGCQEALTLHSLYVMMD